MYRLLLTATAATAILTTTSLIPDCAAAIPLRGQADIPTALELVTPIEKVALCFYFDGWNGPGLYECGYRRYGEGFVRREREERRERFEDRERRERFEDRRERRERFEDRERHERFEDRR